MLEEIRSADAGRTYEGIVEESSKTQLRIIDEKDFFAQKGKNGRELSMAYNWNILAEKFHENLTLILNKRHK